MKTKLLLFILIFSSTIVSANKVVERDGEQQSLSSREWLSQFNQERQKGLQLWVENPEVKLDSIVDITSELGGGQKFSFTYNLSTLSESVITATRRSSTTKWVNAKRVTTQYNASGAVLSVLTENADDTDDTVFEEWSLISYSYTAEGLLEHRTTQLNFGSGFIASQRIVYEYNTLNQLVTEISQMFDNDSWINSLKYEYTYDENGNLLTSIRYYLNGTDWMANYKEEYDYNNASVLVSYTASRVSFFDNSWMVADHIKYEYDEDNLLITEQPYSLDMETEDWIIDEYGNVISYVYDSNGNLISGTKTVCYSETECYGERYMLTTMNSNKDVILGGHNMLYDLNLIGINDLSNLSIESLSIENIAGSTWSVSTDRAIYYSSSSTTSTPEIELSKEVIYVKNRTIYLEESQSVSVFTVTGIVIFNGTASSIEIDQPGVYVVRTSRGVHKLVIS